MARTKNTLKTDTARDYRRKYGMKMPTLALARIMQKENELLFYDVELARKTLRYIEGKAGKELKAKAMKEAPEFIMAEERPRNPYNQPESWSEPKKVFKLPIACNRIGFMSDFQVPFHDNKAISVFCEWLKTKNVNTIFLNGDVMDFYGISSYERDPSQRKFKYEIDAGRAMLAWIRGEFPDATIYYNMDSNHELRWERWLIQKAKEVLGMDEFDMPTILRLNEHNIIPLRNHKYILIGKLPVLHGHTIFGRWGSGVSKARTVFLKTLKACIASHVHVTDEYTKKDLSGKMITCWTTGAFMNVDAVEYNEHNDYNHGGAYIETDKDGNYSVENKRINNYKVV